MSNLFVTRKLALKLEELGFNEQCVAISKKDSEEYFSHEIEHFSSKEKVKYIFGEDAVLLPTWDQAISWIHLKLDDAYSFLTLTYYNDKSGHWQLDGTDEVDFDTEHFPVEVYFSSQEEILETAINLLENNIGEND